MTIAEPPQTHEFAPFYSRYIDLAGTGPVLQTLRQLREGTGQYFDSLAEEKGNYAYAPGKWTIKQVVGHLIDSERIFAYRALCISRGETQPLPGFDQDAYVAGAAFNRRTLSSLALEFRTVRESSLYMLEALTPGQWMLTGTANEHPVSVRALAYIMAGHEMHHLQILKERY